MSTAILTNHPAVGGEVTKQPSVPHTASIQQPKPVAQHTLLMKALAAGQSVLTMSGVQVKGLTVHSASSDPSSDPGGFVAKGTIDLFGKKDIIAELDIWHGLPPPGVTIGAAAPSVQRAVTKGSVKLSQLIPSLTESSLAADISLQNVSIYHQNYLCDPTKGLGFDLEADLVLDSSLDSLSSTLSKVLAVNESTVHVRANLGSVQNWHDTPNIDSLKIEGSFVGHTYAPTTGMHITTVCVRLILERGPNKTVTRDIEVFGTLNLTPPGGSILPIELDYTLKDADGAVQLTANLPSGVTWVNPMGVQGFVLNPATFSSIIPLTDPWKGLTLDIAAKFQYQNTIVHFTGSYAPGSASSLHASIQGFDLASLEQLYEAVHHEPLKSPNVDVTIESADLTIETGKGFSATLTNVEIAGHGSANALLNFSSTGSVTHADLGSVRFGDVAVDSAYIQLDLEPASSPKASDATIHGDIKFEALEIKVAVHLYHSAPSVVPRRTEWTMFAELTTSDNAIALSKIEPRLKGTAFDLTLKSAVFIAASQDDPDVGGALVASAYQPKEGVQVFATFDKIPVFNSLAKSNVAGMVLNASWSKSAGFGLDVLLPVARNLTLGKGITTTPVTLSLDLTPSSIDKAKLIPSLRVSAGLNIHVAHSPAPLLFQMILTAMETDTTIAAELKGNWVNPFGICNEVFIGPDLLLQADLDYVTGLEGVLFKGGLAIGQVTASVAVSVSEDPLKEMLYAEIDNLRFADVVSFAEKLLRVELPTPPSDFLEFETVKIYVCPAGLTVQGVVYPRGFSFKSDMIVFGKNVHVSCHASDTLLSINGSVDDFDVGPLKVSGLDGAKQAILQVHVGKDVQHLLLDGAVTLYGETYGLHLLVDMHPKPEVSFKIEFKLTELLTFEANATLIGALNFKDLGEADFTFDVDLEQHHIDYVRDELLKLFANAQHAAKEGIDAAKKRVATERTTLDNDITREKARLELARNKLEAHQRSVNKANSKIIQDYDAKIEALEKAIDNTKKKYNATLQNAQKALTNAQHDRHVKIQAAENELENLKRKATADIVAAKCRLASAQAAMDHKFGSVESSVETAKHRVQRLQGRIDRTSRDVRRLEHGSWLDKLKVPALEAEYVGLEASLEIAQGVSAAAEAVLRSSNYVADKAALDAAQEGLDLAARAGPALVSDCEKALWVVDRATQAAVDRASAALRLVEGGSDKIAFDGVVAALVAYKRVHDALYEGANSAIADLDESAEYVTFRTARTALAAAQSATKGLDAADAVLSETEKVSVEMLDIGEEIVRAGAEALHITSLHVSGSLGKSVGGGALKADVKGVVLNRPFATNVDLTPSKVEHFLKDLFLQLKHELKKDLHL